MKACEITGEGHFDVTKGWKWNFKGSKNIHVYSHFFVFNNLFNKSSTNRSKC